MGGRRMNPVICIEMIYPGIKQEEKITKIKQAGFSWIEFWDWRDKNIKLLHSSCHQLNIKVTNFSGQRKGDLIASATHKQLFADLKEAINVAEKLNCPYLMLLTDELGNGGIVKNNYTSIKPENKYNNIISGLKKAISLTPEPITLVLEILNTKIDHPGYYLDNMENAVKIIREINHPRLKILADLYHLGVMGYNIKQIINQYLPEIGYFHIADIPGRHEPGRGNINWKDILELLKKKGYNGCVGFEYSPAHDSDESLVKIKNLWQSVFPEYS
jgi:hydroxypyruvate isomerase